MFFILTNWTPFHAASFIEASAYKTKHGTAPELLKNPCLSERRHICAATQAGNMPTLIVPGGNNEGPFRDTHLASFKCCRRSRVQDLLNGRCLRKGILQSCV